MKTMAIVLMTLTALLCMACIYRGFYNPVMFMLAAVNAWLFVVNWLNYRRATQYS